MLRKPTSGDEQTVIAKLFEVTDFIDKAYVGEIRW
jgi:hypothetical protein